MPKKVCPNGHIYDSSIYGDECPLCPKSDNNEAAAGLADNALASGDPGTHIEEPRQQAPAGSPGIVDPIGGTKLLNPKEAFVPGRTDGTVIRQPGGNAGKPMGRKLVGFLVTYNRNPLGKAYNLYEGKNYIGRDRSCDVFVPEDNQMSGRHMSILYRNVDNKFKYRDEQSSNGTFVNKELSDEGELHNYDIIRLGNTVFIFIAIPKLG